MSDKEKTTFAIVAALVLVVCYYIFEKTPSDGTSLSTGASNALLVIAVVIGIILLLAFGAGAGLLLL